jgi:hypothetical protein
MIFLSHFFRKTRGSQTSFEKMLAHFSRKISTLAQSLPIVEFYHCKTFKVTLYNALCLIQNDYCLLFVDKFKWNITNRPDARKSKK